MDPTTHSLVVPASLDGERLDRTLAALLDGPSRTRLREMIEDGRVRVGGDCVRRPAHPVVAGQPLEIELVERDRARPGSNAEVQLAILHEDEHLLAFDKPAGMVVHPGPTVRGGTVSERLTERYGPLPSPQGEDRPGIVHRLDADTSGVMVAARSEEAATNLLEQFAQRKVTKRYLALVHGDPRFDSEWIEAPLGRSSEQRDRISVVPEGREAETFYEVLERFGRFALLACYPKTGRMHQIRVHMAHVDHPIVGDTVYRGARGTRRAHLPKGASIARQALHAQRLELRHPSSGEELVFEAPPAPDFARLLEQLRGG